MRRRSALRRAELPVPVHCAAGDGVVPGEGIGLVGKPSPGDRERLGDHVVDGVALDPAVT